MSDQSNYNPSDDPINGLKPLSNGDGFSLPIASHDGLRSHDFSEAIMANGLPLEETDEDDDDEEVDEDYVAVDHDDLNEYPYWLRRPPVRQRSKLDDLYPFVQVLTESNVDDCVLVEEAFPEQERCSREKFIYRLGRCPELCLGLFTLPILSEDEPKPRPTLVGHIIATRTASPYVTDKAMELPADWQTNRSTMVDGEIVGHDETGRSIAIHSLAVLREHQGKHVGSTLMKAYIQRIREAAIADRIVIIAHDHLVPFYQSFGFENRGPSKCQFGGGGWTDLVLEFSAE
ncbi:polyamine acetyltransferase [Aspergillus lucknowensis]|uniref:N-acetyltransferase domain-containing protein n=1 Tax=Aspergillus lucknowensis TaxID=176173 RepID=A0ABR4M6S5_9EURO